jgi:hypothetical protein
MKETLVQICVEKAKEHLSTYDSYDNTRTYQAVPEDELPELVANTLKQVAEALEGMKDKIDVPIGEYGHYYVEVKIEDALTDAQKVIRGELDI